MEFIKKYLLLFTVFSTGASVLIVEVVAVRILSPFYGNTIFTVSSIISVILAALSLGYYIGGKLADRKPSIRLFFGIILLSGLTLLFLHFIGIIMLQLLSLVLSISSGPLVSSLFLFFIPALLLGTLSPYAIKLQSVRSPEQGIGSVAGKIFFWSTFGSIFGSLLAGFYLIPNFGINQIMIASGVFLFFLGLIPLLVLGLKKTYVQNIFFASLLVFSLSLVITANEVDGVVYSKDGVYEKLTIYDGIYEERPTRFFMQDRSNSGAMFLDSDDPTDLVFEFSKYYILHEIFTPKVENGLIIGGATNSITKALLADFPNANVDVYEIEPSLFELSKKYFKLVEEPRLKNYVGDGRHLLQKSNKKYDFIFGDAFSSLFSIPPHLTTKEFFLIVNEKLNEDGIVVLNIIGDLFEEQPSFLRSEMRTFKFVFPNSYFFATVSPNETTAQNFIFVGYKSDNKIDVNAPYVINHPNETISSLKDKIVDVDQLDLSSHILLTDNYSPVEYMISRVLKRTYSDNSFEKEPNVL